MWFMGYMIYLRMGVSSQVTLARQFGELRAHVRSKFRDVYSNSPTVSVMYKWFEKLAIERPGPRQEVAAVEWENDDVPNSTSSALARKRKNDQRDDDDSDYRGTSSRSNGRAAPAPKTRKTLEASRSSVNRPPPVPPPPAVRPPPSSMDAAPIPRYGSQHGGVSPYAISDPHGQRQHQVRF
jgi:hypothetical protein